VSAAIKQALLQAFSTVLAASPAAKLIFQAHSMRKLKNRAIPHPAITLRRSDKQPRRMACTQKGSSMADAFNTYRPHRRRRHAVLASLSASLMVVAFSLLPGTGHAQEDTQTVLLGFAGPLSGSSAKVGKGQQQAVELAIADANAHPFKIDGKKIQFKLLAQDDRGDARTATLVADYLVKAGVVAVIGHWNTAASLSAAPIYARANLAQIAPGSTGRQYTQGGSNSSFRIVGHDDEGGIYAGNYAVRTLNARRIAVIDDDTVFGRNLATQFIASLRDNGETAVARESINSKTSDFNAALSAIKSKNPDLIFFGGLGAQAATLTRSIARMQMTVPLMAADGTVGPLFIELAGADGNGTLALAPGLPQEKMNGWKAFEKKYRNGADGDIDFFAPFAYDAAQVLIAAIRQNNSLDPQRIAATLHGIRFTGLSAAISFDAEGNLNNAGYTMYQLKNQKWQALKTFGGGGR
jgi:branched-chain amino acid transport system substrate-binding protein